MSTRTERAARLYGARSPEVGSPDLALSSYYSRRESGLRNDPERLEQARAERRQLQALVRARNVPASRVHEGLSVLLEHETKQASAWRKPGKSPEPLTLDQAKARFDAAYAQGFEKLRLEEGSSEAAAKVWDRMRAGLDVLTKECPQIVARGSAPEVAADLRTVRFLASLAEEPPQPPPAAA